MKVDLIKTPEYLGKEVELFGWIDVRRDHGKLIFFDLRDRTGKVQLVITPGNPELHKLAETLRPEWVVKIKGEAAARPEAMKNPKEATGEIEIKVKSIEVLARAQTPPFDISGEGRELDEETRLKYRYLDLRRPRLRRNLEMRHKIISYMRNYLNQKGFLEVDTPILTKATPEGARDFLVPSRLQPGKFYALPQSPQQYKQLLMVAGIEKYFQIARCFRDEDPRADRSYGEFSQLDIEMSFATQDEILSLAEELLIKITEEVVGKTIYKKPFPRFTHAEALKKFGADKFDLRETKDPNVLAFAWVTDFPLFETTETRELTPYHHPFTAPKDEDVALLDSNPSQARSWQHDLVCNGLEVGGGSLRITNPELQKTIFKILGHGGQEIEEKFGHLLEAFSYGVPPHGGIAPGVERLLMVWLDEPNTREVTPFPITAGGRTAVMDAPSKVSKKELEELGIQVKAKSRKRNSGGK
ncbi:aspartate--tRNA ligase [Candidatus Giovannonibacteria bacterium]|nr:aspartate--tRNA ligase [Candidatus Giovannonibacteria bacterium]